jgi:hypothetical protein
MQTSLRECGWVIAAVFGLSMAASCATGPMAIAEKRYYAVPGQDHTNYFRLRVAGQTKLSVADYRSGWFPTEAVDSLYGDISPTSNLPSLRARTALEEEISAAVLQVERAWLAAAQDPRTTQAELDELQQARRRVVMAPASPNALTGAVEIEFDPRKGIAVRHSDEKLVFVLAANPDEVIGKIAQFAEDQKTALEVERLGSVVEQRVRNDAAALEGRSTVGSRLDGVLSQQLAIARSGLESETRDGVMARIDLLVDLLDSIPY